jgi:Helix-turn-helix domain
MTYSLENDIRKMKTNLPSKPKQLLNLAVASDLTLSKYQLRLMLWLIDHAHHKTGSCFPSEETLLEELGVSTERKKNDKYYLQKNLFQLKAKGWICTIEYDKSGRRYITLAWDRAFERDKSLAQLRALAKPDEADRKPPVEANPFEVQTPAEEDEDYDEICQKFMATHGIKPSTTATPKNKILPEVPRTNCGRQFVAMGQSSICEECQSWADDIMDENPVEDDINKFLR